MHIDQTKLTDNVVKNLPNENAGIGIENYIVKPEVQSGFFATKSEAYSSEKTAGISSGGNVNMANVTYQKPFSEEEKKNITDNLSNQMNMSAEDRKNQMAVVSNTTTPEDYQKMQEDGFSFANASSQTIITETDKIKAVLAKAGVDISIYGDDLSKERLQEITGNAAVAVQIENQMKSQDIPVTTENMEDAKRAYSQAAQIGELSEEAIIYMIKNDQTPTIANLYKAQFSSQTVRSSYNQGISMTDEELEEMSEQIQQMIENFGMPANEENVQDGYWLVRNGIELNPENMSYLQQLQSLSIIGESTEEIVSGIVQAIVEGNRPADAMMIDGYSLKDKAENAVGVISDATDADIEYIIDEGLELNIHNLGIAENIRKYEIGTNTNSDSSVDKGAGIRAAQISARRVLEETRLLMTTQASYSLLKKGISIDTKPLEMLVDDLKQQEKQYYVDLMQQNGVEVTDEKVDTFSNVMSIVEETKWQPAYALTINSAYENFETIHANGINVKADFEKANERYATMMTTPRADLGDNIRKAFRNVDEILADLGLDDSEENQRAVRILAYNETELSVENINTIKAADEEIQRAFKNMTPAVVLEMIRSGVLPLDLNISELNNVAAKIKEEIGDESADKFSKFLWKLEKNNQISEEERESYIGIYRLFAQVEKADGASIGALINQGSELTIRNLLTAVRSKQKGEMDYKIDDDFSGVNTVNKGNRIDDQIMAAYNQNCVRDIMDIISPENMKSVLEMDWEDMTPEQLKASFEEANINLDEETQELDYQYTKEELQMLGEAVNASEDIYRYLDRYDIQNSVINVIATSRMIRNPNKMFGTIFNEDEMRYDDINRIRDIKEQILERFSEAIKTPQELADAQETLAEVAAHVMDNMIIEDRRATSIDVREMKLVCNQFSLAAAKAKEESFVVPVETGDGVTGISLKIIRGKEDKGLVDIFFRTESMGNVAASFEAKDNGISGVIATSDNETRKIFADNLDLLVSDINGGNGINDGNDINEAVDIRVAYVQEISSEHFEMSSLRKEEKIKAESEQDKKNPVQTKRLYNIAESFIKVVQELNNFV